jgi:hypothetical protein
MNFDKAATFIWQNGRLLERRLFEYYFQGGSKDGVLQALRAYLNADGGFGHALEPDLRTPDSQPLYAEFGLRTLYEAKIRDADLASRVCDYVSRVADLSKGIMTITPSSRNYPRAPHWNNPSSEQPDFSRLTSIVGLLNWQDIWHPWLNKAVEACLNHLSSNKYEDAHTIQNAFCLLESLPQTADVRQRFAKLADELQQARFFLPEAPPQGYGLTPLDFAPFPDSYCRTMFSDAAIRGHLKALAAQQEDDGGWPITWEPPGEMAKLEWRAHRTLRSLVTLESYRKAGVW